MKLQVLLQIISAKCVSCPLEGRIVTLPSGPCAEQETEDLRVGVERIDHRLSLCEVSRTIKTAKLISLPYQVVLQDIHQFGHLTEKKNLVTPRHQLRQHSVKELELPAGHHQQMRLRVAEICPRGFLRLSEQKWMVTNLPKVLKM